jgi:hypothetical protein
MRAAVQERSQAERHLINAMRAARECRHVVGTSGEAARQRYSSKVA